MGAYDFNFNLPPDETYAPSDGRVEALAALMPREPFSYAPTAADRSAWNPWRADPFGERILKAARELAAQPFPDYTDAAFLDCLAREDVTAINAVLGIVRRRQVAFLLAEAIHDRGEFIGPIGDDIRRLAVLRTWIHPGNDLKRLNYEGKTVEPDLGVVHFAANMAQAGFILGARLPRPVRSLIAAEADRRLFAPLRGRILSGRDLYWWIDVKHNWNAVCLASCAEAAMALVPSARERAWWLAFASSLILNSRDGYNDDGLCTEGTGYWSYAYIHYVALSEILRIATGGAADLLDEPKMARVGRFPDRSEIQPGVFPTYADCALDAKPSAWARIWSENRRGTPRVRGRLAPVPGDPFSGMGLQFAGEPLLWMFRASDPRRPVRLDREPGLRDWFDASSFLVCRSGPGTGRRLAATLKGGNNGTNHHHNDLGTFTVVLDGRTLVADPGTETYSFRTFSTHRYDSQLINSYGHPVPRVAGLLQETGPERRTRVLAREFTDAEDRVVLDLRLAYNAPGLLRLEREFVFDRRGAGSVTVSDSVEFVSPSAFESALVTLAPVVVDGLRIRLGDGPSALVAEVDASGAELEIVRDTINQPPHPVRLALRCRGPVARAQVRAVLRPA